MGEEEKNSPSKAQQHLRRDQGVLQIKRKSGKIGKNSVSRCPLDLTGLLPTQTPGSCAYVRKTWTRPGQLKLPAWKGGGSRGPSPRWGAVGNWQLLAVTFP